MADLYTAQYNPDVLTCLANLSNDEVFTPPEVANQMLDMLPQELFSDPNTTFLDPACKSGVFLREIAKRLIKGLEAQIPDLQVRIDHIFHHQLYAIAITELTSLLARRSVYCSKVPNSKYSITRFEDASGNIRYKRIRHTWQNGKCLFCGASESEYERGDELETHAYEWIHTVKPEEVFGMKFDVIIGNPPYQLSDGGFGISATPIYHKFILQAQKINPRCLVMIVPARWFSGGRGLDSFRDRMLHDNRIRIIHDYPEASDCFQGVQIKGGICYFLWDREWKGDCAITTHRGNDTSDTVSRPLLEKNCTTFIRYNIAVEILNKVNIEIGKTFDSWVSTQRPFGLRTYIHGKKEKFLDSVTLYENGSVGYISREEITKNEDCVDQYKVFIPRSSSGSDAFPHPIIGKPFIGLPGSASTETYIFVGPTRSKSETENVISYMQTKFFRYLVMLKKVSQDIPKTAYSFVPMQDSSKPWTDEELYAKYSLTEEEIAFIESMIKPME